MSKQINKLIPKLRFPEFKNEGEWDVKIVSEVAKYENGKAHEQDIDEKGKYVVVNSKFISTDGEVRKFSNLANCIAKKNDVLMVLSDVPKGRAIAKCFYVDKGNYYTVNQRICKISPVKVDSKLLLYLLNRNQFFLNFDDGVKQTNLRNEDVLNCPLILPKNPKEQQKIASCLSSLDDLIEAHNQKLDLLKEHKKGLMQNLFPQEGEKVPKLRFKEFENDGEWEFKALEDALDYERPDKYIVSDTNYQNVGTPVLTANKSFILGYTNEDFGIYNKLPAIIFDDFTVDSKFVHFPFKVKSSAIKILTPKKKDDLRFVYELISQIDFNATEHKRYYISEYQKLKFPFPSIKEQQKIASCLSALDELIKAQAEKIEQLQQHKKGLMQGLFPKMID